MIELRQNTSVIASIGSVLGTLLPGVRPAIADDVAGRAEVRAELFARLSILAQGRGLHVAPSVSLGSVFAVQEGRRRSPESSAQQALSNERVDILLLDASVRPVLAMDFAEVSKPKRGDKRRFRIKSRLFERAGLPLVVLRGIEDWAEDRADIERRIKDAIGA